MSGWFIAYVLPLATALALATLIVSVLTAGAVLIAMAMVL